MRVQEIMTRAVGTCRASDNLNAAARIMRERNCGCVPVVDGESKVVGMLTDRDICLAAYAQGKPLADIPVQGTMSKSVWSCTPYDSLAAAEKIMQTKRVRRLPVLDGEDSLVGIISLHDIAREVVRQCECMHRQVTAEEVGRVLSRIYDPAPTPANRGHAPA